MKTEWPTNLGVYRPSIRPSIFLAESCKTRPPDIRDGYGMVRYYSNMHGAKSKYMCNTGYKLEGDEFLTCEYGQWVGQRPHCSPSESVARWR